jgi:hypothetical protein
MILSESDTRAKLINPALYTRGWTEDHIRREANAGGLVLVRGRWKREQKLVDYLLSLRVEGHPEMVPVAIIEAKRNTLPPHYGLEQAKVRKRTPLTLGHFDHFFEMLARRRADPSAPADSDYSWTVDLDTHKQEAKKEAQPLQQAARDKRRQVARLKRRLKEAKAALRGQGTLAQLELTDDEAAQVTQADVDDLERQIKNTRQEARELANRTQAILDAVYDLKAVNPNNQVEEDTRTPAELIAIIEQQGRELAAALAQLKGA